MGATYVPLTAVSAAYASHFYRDAKAYVERAKKAGSLPPGRAEQYDLQLATLKDESIPDLEICHVPGFLTFLACE